MKKITFVCLQMGSGGAERVISILINDFVRKGYKVQLITLYSDSIEYPIPENVDIVFLGWKLKESVIKRILRAKQLRSAITGDYLILLFYPIVRDTVFATLGMHKKIIASERNYPNADAKGWFHKFIRMVSYQLSDICVFQTEEAKAYFPKFIQKKGVVIPNPVREDLPEMFHGDREKKIVAAGRLEPQKNFSMLIKAFSKLYREFPEYDLYIYGRGSLQSELQDLAKNLGLSEKVKLPGFVENINELMNSASIYVSSSDYEGISNSMVEALAMGVPTVCTDCPIGGARMMIKNGESGILIPVGDEDALYRAMKKIIEEHEFAEKISKNAYKVRDEYNANMIAQRWLELL